MKVFREQLVFGFPTGYTQADVDEAIEEDR